MYSKYIKSAESIGNQIASSRRSDFFTLSSAPLTSKDYVRIQLKPFRMIEGGIWQRQGFLKNFMNIQEDIYIVTTGNKSDLKFVIWLPGHLTALFENVFFANFPTSDIVYLSKFALPPLKHVDFGDGELYNDSDFIKWGAYLDPFKDLLSTYEQVHDRLDIVCRYQFRQHRSRRKSAWKWCIWQFSIASAEPTDMKKEVAPVAHTLDQNISFGLSFSYSTPAIMATLQSVLTKYLKNGTIKLIATPKLHTLTISQIINFFHFVDGSHFINGLDYSLYRKLPAPPTIPTLDDMSNKNDLTILGKADYKSNEKQFGIIREDKLRHMYIIGQTGTGKSKFIANMVRSDMISNKGVCVIDPHGDLVDDIMSQIPSYRTNDVVLFDVSDRDFPIGFNIFEYEREEEKPLIASGVVGIFKKMFDTSWWPRLEYILRNVILSLLEYPGATFLHMVRMLTDENFKNEVLTFVTDPVVLKFWTDEYNKRQPKQREEAVAPITNKVGQFTSSTIVRNIFGQWTTKLNFRKMMDEGKIILVNLSKWKIGEDSMAMIGSFIVSKIQIDAMSRADIDESQRKDFYLYIDEFQNFATDSFSTILSEARKYKLSLIMANQFTAQIEENVRAAIFGNVGTIMAMRIGKDDADVMSKQFKDIIQPNDFLSLPNRKAYIKLMIRGYVSDPFSMTTGDFVKTEDADLIKDKIRKQSRMQYAMERVELEQLIKIWASKKFTPAEKVMEKAKEDAAKAKARKEQQEKEREIWLTSANVVVNNVVVPLPANSSIVTLPLSTSSTASPEISWSILVSETKDASWTITEVQSDTPISQLSSSHTTETSSDFSLADIVMWEEYDGLVKLKYNYGVFVTVLGVEWLLHKNLVLAPEGISWKKIYEIGDPIKVVALETKEINGIDRIVRGQKSL